MALQKLSLPGIARFLQDEVVIFAGALHAEPWQKAFGLGTGATHHFALVRLGTAGAFYLKPCNTQDAVDKRADDVYVLHLPKWHSNVAFVDNTVLNQQPILFDREVEVIVHQDSDEVVDKNIESKTDPDYGLEIRPDCQRWHQQECFANVVNEE